MAYADKPAEKMRGRQREVLETAVVRFAGDSGDGVQLLGNQFTTSTALAGSDVKTFPDFPAEIRAPAGTTFGVSAFQINFGARRIMTIGDRPDVLVALNPAALKVNLPELAPGCVVVLDTGGFKERDLKKAGFERDPRHDGTLGAFRVAEIEIAELTKKAVADTGLSPRDQARCKNFWALGLVLWMFDRDRAPVSEWIAARFRDKALLADANRRALDAGHAYGETVELGYVPVFRIDAAPRAPGLWRTVTGHEALAFGLVDGAHKAGVALLYCSYPITPASALLHNLAGMKALGVTTFQAEDEIAAICAAIGASYAGSLGVTGSSGPGIALKTEAIGLAVATELPLVIVNAQRAGPSTGMPTKTEQSDLLQAVYGRNGDTPIVVLACATPADCFDMAREAVRLATQHMTPVMLLTDGFLANAAEPWRIPDLDAVPDFPVAFHHTAEGFEPFARDQRGVRPWVKPGTPGLAHRIGGLEKDSAGRISYDAQNHERMTDARWDKVQAVADAIPQQTVEQGGDGRIAVIGWGSTYGAISRAVTTRRADGLPVDHLHLRYLWPLPRNLRDVLRRYEGILVPEMNKGQLTRLLRAELLVDARALGKVTGKPFTIHEIEEAIDELFEELA